MNKPTTIINHSNSDKILEICISDNRYIVFTMMNRNLIIIECTNKDKPILLLNRSYPNKNVLSTKLDKIIIAAANANDSDDFLSNLDVYIDLCHTIPNEAIKEIIAMYKVVLETYNL